MRPPTAAALILLAAVLSSPVGRAEPSDADKATARSLGMEGLDALDKHDFVRAKDLLERADKLYPAPTITVGLGRAYAGVGRLVSALEAYRRVVHTTLPPGAPKALRDAQGDATRELAALEPRVASLDLRVTGPASPEVLFDGETVPVASLGVPRPIDPGKHSLRVSADRYSPEERTLSATEGQKITLRLEMKPLAALLPTASAIAVAPPVATSTSSSTSAAPPPAGRPWQRGAGIGAMAVGGASLVVGVVAGVLVIGKKSSLSDACPGGVCASSKQGDLDSFRALRTVSTVGFVAGLALEAVGAALFFTAPGGAERASLSPFVGPDRLGVAGRF